MECYCEPDEGEPCEVWKSEWRKARKVHRCVECKEPITVGERYQHTFTIFQGEVGSHKTCEFCVNERTRILSEYRHLDGLVPGDLACALVAELRGDL